MSTPASVRRPVVSLMLATTIATGGCGNRGALYLETSADADIEAEIRALEGGPPLPGSGPVPATGAGSGAAATGGADRDVEPDEDDTDEDDEDDES